MGPQYRSAIFVQTPEQARIAAAYIAQLNQEKAFPSTVVTRSSRASSSTRPRRTIRIT